MVLSRGDRVDRLVDGLREAGYRVIFRSDASDQPLLLELRNHGSFSCRIFSWGITHGGATRDPDEFRVQTTRPGAQQLLEPDEQTLLLGYDEQRDVFAAWDVRVHPNPGTSSSLQVSRDLLDAAKDEGIASRSRHITTGVEMVVAFRPREIGTYFGMLPHLPGPDASELDIRAAAKAGSDEEIDIEELPDDVERRESIHEIRTRVRDQRFRERVLRAYDGRCAFCGIDAGLVQAAHIEGVAEEGADLITNGIAACPTHHAAFDRGLLVVDDDYRIIINEPRLRMLGAGEQEIRAFRSGLFDQLAAPVQSDIQPPPERFAVHRERWLD